MNPEDRDDVYEGPAKCFEAEGVRQELLLFLLRTHGRPAVDPREG